MIPFSIAELAHLLDAQDIPADPARDVDVVAVMTDSRVHADGPAVFFALATDRADGHDHVRAAADAGASVAVVERPVDDVPIRQLVVDSTWRAIGRLGRQVVDDVGCRVVAITGSYGKTTVKDLVAAALGTRLHVAASHGSFNNELGVPLTMLAVGRDTQVLVAEAGARQAGDIATLGALLRPDLAVVTAVGPVHLETFGTEEGVAAEKGRLVRALGPNGTAILNADDPRVAAMRAGAPAALMVGIGDATADVHAERHELDRDGRVRAQVRTPWGAVELRLPLPGAHHLTNALLALATAGAAGVEPVAAADGIATAPTSPSRSSLREVAGVTILDDAYNASPPTMRAALATLTSLACSGRRWAVLGVMAELGPDAEQLHRAVGAACRDGLDELVVVGDAAEGIAAGAAQGGGSLRVRRVADHGAAAELVLAELGQGDAVLFKASRVATLDLAAARVTAALEEGLTA